MPTGRPADPIRHQPGGRHIGDTAAVLSAICDIARWVSDDPWPGLVEARLIDAGGEIWTFIDKAPIFTTDFLGPDDRFPRRGYLRCILLSSADQLGVIETTDTEAVDGTKTFEISLGLLAADHGLLSFGRGGQRTTFAAVANRETAPTSPHRPSRSGFCFSIRAAATRSWLRRAVGA